MRTAAILSLLVLGSCHSENITYSTDYDSLHMFGDRLDAARGARLLCWPGDAEGKTFRCIEDRIDKPLREQAVTLWPDSVPTKEPVGSVIVILPPDASDALRSRAATLADAVTRGNARAGRHFVTADSSWQEVTGGEALAKRLSALHQEAEKWRLTSSDDGLFISGMVLGGLTPYVIVVPLEGDADRYLVFQGIRQPPMVGTPWKADSRSYLSSSEIRSLPARADDQGYQPPVMVFDVVVAESAGPEARGKAARLVAELLSRPRTSVYVRQFASAEISRGVVNPEELNVPYIWDVPVPAGIVGTEQPDASKGR